MLRRGNTECFLSPALPGSSYEGQYAKAQMLFNMAYFSASAPLALIYELFTFPLYHIQTLYICQCKDIYNAIAVIRVS